MIYLAWVNQFQSNRYFMSYKMTWGNAGVYIKFHGKLVLLDVQGVNDSLYSDPRFDDLKYQIADYSDITDIDLSQTDVTVISTLERCASIWNDNLKVAHVATNPVLIQNILDYKVEMEQTNWQIGLFDNLDDAMKWCEE